jgi:uncharacterized membrane protein YphA (DoxX/SURF4 family)
VVALAARAIAVAGTNLLAFPEFLAAVRTLVGFVFLSAAIGKFRHWLAFRGVVANYRLLPEWLVPTVAYVLPLVESAIGVLLLSGLRTRVADAAAIGLLLVFALAMAVNVLRGRAHIDCGCFQSALRQPLSWILVLRNAVLAALLGTAAVSVAGVAGPADRFGGLLAGGALFVVLQRLNLRWSLASAGARPGGAGRSRMRR